MLQDRRRTLIVLGFGAALLAAALFSFALGRYPVPVSELARILWSRVFPAEATWTPTMEAVVLNVRLPRVLLALMVGASLSAAGATYQGIFQNPMASPDILGASAGAAFGAALAIRLGGNSGMIALSAFFAGLLAVALSWLSGRAAKGRRTLGLILSGILIGSLFSAGTSFIKLAADPMDQLPKITYWLMGSLAGASQRDVALAFWPILIGLLPMLLLRFRINLLTLGDEEARALGVPAGAIRFLLIIGATLMTAASVAVGGMIGWVGLVVPHLCRKLVGNDHRWLTPLSMLFGSLFLLIVDNLSRNLFATEIPLGILTAFFGAPVFLWLVAKGGEGF